MSPALHQTPPPSRVTPRAWKVIPFFRSASIAATNTFYTQTLSFTLSGMYPDPPAPPTFASLQCGPKAEVNIYFLHELDGAAPPPGRAMVAVDRLEDVAALFEELRDKGIKVLGREEEQATGEGGRRCMSGVRDTDWGYRQFELWDPDGNRLVFFAFLEL